MAAVSDGAGRIGSVKTENFAPLRIAAEGYWNRAAIREKKGRL
jgi:hypothetical protein